MLTERTGIESVTKQESGNRTCGKCFHPSVHTMSKDRKHYTKNGRKGTRRHGEPDAIFVRVTPGEPEDEHGVGDSHFIRILGKHSVSNQMCARVQLWKNNEKRARASVLRLPL